MNILILNYEYPPVGGGGGVISQQIVKGLVATGHNITVLTAWYNGLKESEETDVTIIRLKSKRKNDFRSNPLEMLSWINHSKAYIKKNVNKGDFDISFANFVMPGGIVGLYLQRKMEIPYVVISHGHDIPWVKPLNLYPLFFVNYFRIRRILMLSQFNFLQSGSMKNNCDRFLPDRYSEKNILIPNGCDGDVFFPAVVKGRDYWNIIFVGRLVRQKGPEIFIRTVEILNRSDIKFVADIYGDGPLRSKIEKMIRAKRLEGVVSIHGKVNPDKMVRAYQSSHFMIAPSVSEGMSISVLEALFCGVYIFATNVSGNNELIKDSNYGQFINRDPVKIAEAITSCITHNGNSGLPCKEFRKKYDWKTIIPQYEHYLKRME